MFGRRRHRAHPQPRPDATGPAPQQPVDPEQLFATVRSVLSEYIGQNGTWTLVRRGDDDTDSIFQEISATVFAQAVTASILGTRDGIPVARGSEEPSVVREPGITALTAAEGQPRTATERVTRELDTVAVWADPVRHDPSFVSDELVSPPHGAEQSRNSA
ncbi:hypothetical protein GCM10027416_13170 [Okibacterium endophyticum]